MPEIAKLPEYASLIGAKKLELDENTSLEVSQFQTNTSARYDILQNSQRVGWISLAFHPRTKVCSFDIAVANSGTGIGTRTLILLAKKLTEYGYGLMTGGVMNSSRRYWEKLVEKGIAIRQEIDGEINYQVVRD